MYAECKIQYLFQILLFLLFQKIFLAFAQLFRFMFIKCRYSSFIHYTNELNKKIKQVATMLKEYFWAQIF